MKKLNFKVPLYDFDVTLIQHDNKDDFAKILPIMKNMKCTSEHIQIVNDYIERGCFNGGDTFYNFDLKKILVLFYTIKDEEKRAELYSHEKRHVEDRIIQYCSLDDIEAAAYLSGFLGRMFYRFTKLQG